MNTRRSLGLLLGTLLGLGHSGGHGQTAQPFRKDAELVFLSPDGAVRGRIDAEIAEGLHERVKGLMFREHLGPDQGMLFLFPVEEPRSFWMKNTPLPLDILFLDSERTVVSIRKDTVPYSEKSVQSERPARYVVEVNAGFVDRHGIETGDRAFWQRI
jgi:uncharacterized membrane protein (UPF0127 family)